VEQNAQPVIETKNLSCSYAVGTPFEHQALSNIELAIYPGEYVGVIGHTGSGKSTLIQHLNGLIRPTSGQVLLEGQDIWTDKASLRAARFAVGLVFQYPEYQLFEETVYRDIAFGPKNMGLDADEIDRRVRRAAEFADLSPELLDKSPFSLSGGQKRRAAIAGVIAMEPKVLILDEPTAGLDPAGAERIFRNIQAYHEANGAAVVLVSHSMEDVARLAQRLIVLHNGSIPFSGPPYEVFTHAQELTAMGLGVPQITRVFARLREMGLEIDASVYTIQQAKAVLLDALARRKRG